ncbi:hypothetical protein D3C87_1713380 [compost metagenome]
MPAAKSRRIAVMDCSGRSKPRDCLSAAIMRLTALASRPALSNSRRSKLEEIWISIEGLMVGATPVISYRPVSRVRRRMSLALVAITSLSTGRPICRAQ